MNYYYYLLEGVVFNISIYLFFYGEPINYLFGMLKDAYSSFTRSSFKRPEKEWHFPPMNRANDSPRKNKNPLVVYIHGLHGTPLVWHRYYHEHARTGATIYTPWILWHRDNSTCLVEWDTPIQPAIQAFINENPEASVTVYSTSYGSIFANDMLMELIEKNTDTQFNWYSIVGADLHGSWWCRFWLSRLFLKYVVKLPPVVIERLARKYWSYEEYVNAKMLEEDQLELRRFNGYNKGTFKRNFKHVAWVEKYDWQLFFNPKEVLKGAYFPGETHRQIIIHSLHGTGHSYVLDKSVGLHS